MNTDVIGQFCDWHHRYNDISADRRAMQRRVLLQFEASLGGRPITSANADDLRDYLATRRATCKATTVTKELRAITPFVRWLWERKLIGGDTYAELMDVKPPRGGNGGAPRPYSRKEITEFWRELDAAYPPGEERYLARFERGSSRWIRVEPYAKRIQIEAIVALALYGGARRVEIYQAELEDLHPENAYLVIRGARKNKEGESIARPVPWNELLKRSVSRWLELREWIAPPHTATWLSLHRQPHYMKPLRWRQFEVLLSQIGNGWEYHRLRHTYATERLRAGLPIELLQREMGHASIQQTLRYAKLVNDDIVRGGARVDPNFTRTMTRLQEAA